MPKLTPEPNSTGGKSQKKKKKFWGYIAFTNILNKFKKIALNF
jgi:hypothetical protein